MIARIPPLFLFAPLLLQAAAVPDDNIRELLRYVHRWHFDSLYGDALPEGTEAVTVHVRELSHDLDEGDSSRHAELWIAEANLWLRLKKAHYTIPELDLEIDSPMFKVVGVEHRRGAPDDLAEYERVSFPLAELVDYLRATLRDNEYPAAELIDRMREQFLKEIAAHPDLAEAAANAPGDEHVFYIAPVSPVSNQVWVYWDNPQIAVGLDADFPLRHLETLDFVASRLHILRLERDVQFVPQAGRTLNPIYSKDWVGRMLVNCMILGERVTLPREEVRVLEELAD